MMQEFVFSFDPWGYEMQVVAATEKEARAIAFANLPDFYKNNCESFCCVDSASAQEKQSKGVSASQFRHVPY